MRDKKGGKKTKARVPASGKKKVKVRLVTKRGKHKVVRRGKHTIVVKYRGNADVTKAKATTKLRVR